jgi:hypothetical protein
MGSAVVWRAESAVVPVLILDDVREGLLLMLGEAAEEIVENLTQPEYEHHPEWFSGNRVLLGEAWACLDEIGWVGGKYPRPVTVSVSEHGKVMARGIAAFLPCLDDFLREAPVNDHDRIARGLPPEFESLSERIPALEKLQEVLAPEDNDDDESEAR